MEHNISGRTQLYCLIGSPIGHSGSPAIYNYSFDRAGIDAVYLAFDVPLDKLEEGIAAIKAFHVKGFNVTMPDKTAVMKYLDEITPAAERIGACNTVKVTDEGKLIGYNTDGIGFTDNLRAHGVKLQGKKAVLLGTGGAATAICVQAAMEGISKIVIFNRMDEFYENGRQIVKRLTDSELNCSVSICDIEDDRVFSEAVRESDILINATKVGMKPMDGISLVDPSLLRPDLVVADTIYNPLETRLMSDAKAAGCRTVIGGTGMLLRQGAAAFKLFIGQEMQWRELQEQFFSDRGE